MCEHSAAHGTRICEVGSHLFLLLVRAVEAVYAHCTDLDGLSKRLANFAPGRQNIATATHRNLRNMSTVRHGRDDRSGVKAEHGAYFDEAIDKCGHAFPPGWLPSAESTELPKEHRFGQGNVSTSIFPGGRSVCLSADLSTEFAILRVRPPTCESRRFVSLESNIGPVFIVFATLVPLARSGTCKGCAHAARKSTKEGRRKKGEDCLTWTGQTPPGYPLPLPRSTARPLCHLGPLLLPRNPRSAPV